MNRSDVPVVGSLLVAGPDDPVFDALLALGPVVIGLVAVLGRSTAGLALASAYVAAIVLNVVLTAVR